MYRSFNMYQYLLASSHVSVPDIFYSESGLALAQALGVAGV
jgi:hypothetical protein